VILADTSVWVDHFVQSDEVLIRLLDDGEVVIHPFILSELACGNFKNRKSILALLNDLPVIKKISDDEYFLFVDRHRLYGIGLGFVDIHLLAAALMARCSFYTRDKSLLAAATSFEIEYT